MFYKDGLEITPDEIIARVNQGSALPKTSAINVDEYRQVFEELLKDADAVLHFNISSEFSSCWQNAWHRGGGPAGLLRGFPQPLHGHRAHAGGGRGPR